MSFFDLLCETSEFCFINVEGYIMRRIGDFWLLIIGVVFRGFGLNGLFM